MRSNSATRLLQLMKVLNQNGASSVQALHEETGLSRAAIYRLLAILQQLGYAEQLQDQARFQLTLAVHELSDRVSDSERLTAIATPLMRDLQRDVLWPSSLQIFSRGRMVTRATTRPYSPFVFDSGHIGADYAVLETAAGRAFLSACSEKKREIVLDFLASSSNPLDQVARNPWQVRRILHENTRRGYAVRVGEIQANTTSLAVPVRVGGEALGALTVSYLNSAMTLQKAEALLLQPLLKVADEVERQLTDTPAAEDRTSVRS
ncbi:helix-turn-helix domain-containing protein [Paraburkholderia sp. ZP32-5]|uniref:helix-turn-helix domain-containing protein n=1 Tax=Paraburkholderia sp. ZP32-5 TaxID=2883245 RepID=UPI001F37AC37|nr:IclR family transcriptional regulator C-terminal domain-containing protein [Paraburkholderia sp. ZP32-5]